MILPFIQSLPVSERPALLKAAVVWLTERGEYEQAAECLAALLPDAVPKAVDAWTEKCVQETMANKHWDASTHKYKVGDRLSDGRKVNYTGICSDGSIGYGVGMNEKLIREVDIELWPGPPKPRQVWKDRDGIVQTVLQPHSEDAGSLFVKLDDGFTTCVAAWNLVKRLS